MASVRHFGIAIGAIAGCVGASLAFADAAPDACRAQIPESLAVAVAKKFPSFELPLVADNLPEDIKYNIKNGGSGCLGIAVGNFGRTGTQDYALALKRRNRKDSITVIATLRGERWSFNTISIGDIRMRLYIGAVPAGHYDASGVAEDPKARRELAALECPHSGIITGETEATGIVYCFVSGKWKDVVVQD
jgi:hypothetical protein